MYRSRFLSSLRIFSLQELLPEILGNMSDTLLVEANKMEAKDEKFISQGIYNMLYGTVELLIVSAEASRVTGDGDTVSTNRSRVGVYLHSVCIILFFFLNISRLLPSVYMKPSVYMSGFLVCAFSCM